MANTVVKSVSVKQTRAGSRDVDSPRVQFHVANFFHAGRSGATDAAPRETSREDQREMLPERPKTAGAPVVARKLAERPQTRDGLRSHPSFARRGDAGFHSISKERSLADRAEAIMSPPMPPTPKYSYDGSDMEIGMALGSPSHPPTRMYFQDERDTNMTPESFDTAVEWKEQPKIKGSKWNLFGLFGKKSATNFYQVQADVTAAETDDNSLPPPPPLEKSRTRMNSLRGPKLVKPKVKRSQTVPSHGQSPKCSSKQQQPETPAIRVEGPMLDVDIPNVEMERYSIMFGSVLQSPTASTGSLLARRQATLERLKAVNEAIAAQEKQAAEQKSSILRPRRASSPQPTSPNLSLFPPTVSKPRDTSPLRPSPLSLHRSNTSPAALSPARQTFLFPPAPLIEVPIMLAATPPQKTTTTATLLSPVTESFELSPVTDTSPTSPLTPLHQTWNLISPLHPPPLRLKNPPPSQPAPSRPSRSDSAIGMDHSVESTSRPSSDQEKPLAPLQPLSSSTEDPEERAIRERADVSIARQISISRRQRLLLVPISARGGAKAAGLGIGNGNGNGSGVAAGFGQKRSPVERALDFDEEGLVVGGDVDVKPVTPQMVFVGGEEWSAVHRKSERVVLEGEMI